MCQPGRPLPSEVSQDISPGLTAFHRAKSRGVVLVVLVEVDAGAIGDVFEIFLGELAVFGVAGEAEVPAAVLGLIGDIFFGQLLDERDHLGDVVGGVGDLFGELDVEGFEVLEEGLLELGGVVGDGDACVAGVTDDLVVDVGDVHDVLDGDSLLKDEAAEDVDVEECAEVADVAVVVDGGAAAVHSQRGGAYGRERFNFSAEGVEEFDSCHVAVYPCRSRPVAEVQTALAF